MFNGPNHFHPSLSQVVNVFSHKHNKWHTYKFDRVFGEESTQVSRGWSIEVEGMVDLSGGAEISSCTKPANLCYACHPFLSHRMTSMRRPSRSSARCWTVRGTAGLCMGCKGPDCALLLTHV